MSYNIIATPLFEKLFKKLAKKYPSLKSDFQELLGLLEDEPETGTPLGFGIYKVRMAFSSKNKGKSGGVRVITFLVTKENEVYLEHIYDKSQLDNLKKKQIQDLLKDAGLV